MAYIGNTATTQAFTPAVDYFNGDNSTVAFTLSKPVASVAQVQAVIENVPQNPGSAYTVSGNTITFTSAPPSGTANIYVYYTSPITQVIAPSQGTVGASQLVGGTVNTTADATLNGVTAGRGAGNVSTNTAVGVSALAANEAGGTNNTAIGYQALDANTTGDQNTAVGDSALGANVTGNNNTAMGYQALLVNTGNANTAVGHSAAKTLTSGGDNSAFGLQALRDTTTGSSNAALGVQALAANTTGSFNTAVGRNALDANTTAGNNTAVGYQAGYTNQTGTFNTFIGQAAGYYSNASSTAANTCIGSYAGYNLSTGVGNTFIGSGTVYQSGSAITTGSNNTILGAYNGNQGGLDIRTASNRIVLSDGDGNPRAYADSNGRWIFATNYAGELITVSNPNASTPYGIYNGFSAAAPNNNAQWFYLSEDTGGLRCVIMANGGIKNYSANNVNLSDVSVKKDIELAGNYLDKICAIPVKTFLYIDQTDTDKNLGVIAQDVQAVAPELVTTTEWGTKENPETKLSVYEADLMFALMKSIQELSAQVTALQAEVNALKGQ